MSDPYSLQAGSFSRNHVLPIYSPTEYPERHIWVCHPFQHRRVERQAVESKARNYTSPYVMRSGPKLSSSQMKSLSNGVIASRPDTCLLLSPTSGAGVAF